MSDQANFPTGNWTGFYKWSRSNFEYTMELILEFESENIDGVGRDPVGQFVVDGFYDPDNGEATWVKRYTGSHDVYYEGYRKHDGIWGTWELSHGAKGGFF